MLEPKWHMPLWSSIAHTVHVCTCSNSNKICDTHVNSCCKHLAAELVFPNLFKSTTSAEHMAYQLRHATVFLAIGSNWPCRPLRPCASLCAAESLGLARLELNGSLAHATHAVASWCKARRASENHKCLHARTLPDLRLQRACSFWAFTAAAACGWAIHSVIWWQQYPSTSCNSSEQAVNCCYWGFRTYMTYACSYVHMLIWSNSINFTEHTTELIASGFCLAFQHCHKAACGLEACLPAALSFFQVVSCLT